MASEDPEEDVQNLSFSFRDLSVSFQRRNNGRALNLSVAAATASSSRGPPGSRRQCSTPSASTSSTPLDRPTRGPSSSEDPGESAEVPADLARLCGRLGPAGSVTPYGRLVRAYQLGVGDRRAWQAAREGGFQYQQAADPLEGVRVSHYVFLADKAGEGPFYTTAKGVYRARCFEGNSLVRASVSRGFAPLACKGQGLRPRSWCRRRAGAPVKMPSWRTIKTWSFAADDGPYVPMVAVAEGARMAAVGIRRRDAGMLIALGMHPEFKEKVEAEAAADANGMYGAVGEVVVKCGTVDEDEAEWVDCSVLVIDVTADFSDRLARASARSQEYSPFGTADDGSSRWPDVRCLLEAADAWVEATLTGGAVPRLDPYVTASDGDGGGGAAAGDVELPSAAVVGAGAAGSADAAVGHADAVATAVVQATGGTAGSGGGAAPGVAGGGALPLQPTNGAVLFRPAAAPAAPRARRPAPPTSAAASPAEAGVVADLKEVLKEVRNLSRHMEDHSRRLDHLENASAASSDHTGRREDVMAVGQRLAGKAPNVRAGKVAPGGLGSGDHTPLKGAAGLAELEGLVQEEMSAHSTDAMLKMALTTFLTQQQKKKTRPRIPGLAGTEDTSGSDQEDGLGQVGGAKHTMALEKLHAAMRKHPGPFADRMEKLAGEVMGESVSSDTGLAFATGELPVGKQRTLGFLMMLLGLIHQAAKKGEQERVRFLALAGLAMGEQFCLDENWGTAWKVFGHHVPPWTSWAQEDVSQLRREHVHSRLMDPRWIGATVGALKDEEVLRKCRGKGAGKTKDEDPK